VKEEVVRVVGRGFLWREIPFSITKNNSFYQAMFDIVVVIGPRYKANTYDELRGSILQREKVNITTRLEDFKKSWETTRCTITPNGWTNGKDKTFLNFSVNCPKGTILLNSLMCLHILKCSIVM
jgi:hypothetical protein